MILLARTSRRRLLRLGLAASLLAAAAPFAAAQDDSSFGTSTKTGEAALIGILYDLKQTQQREPTKETTASYRHVLTEFYQSDWDEAVLNRYFRVSRPVYTTQIAIEAMSADQAPKAFGVDHVVEPRMWAVHYKGQVAPPEDGLYRFSGQADDIMAVRVNGRLVLVAGQRDCLPPPGVWSPPEPTQPNSPTHGDWIALKAGETVDFDVLIGERPGGRFHAHLFVSKQGAPFQGSRPPYFKLAAGTKTPKTGAPETSWSVWNGKQ
jgi:hypothetical protein